MKTNWNIILVAIFFALIAACTKTAPDNLATSAPGGSTAPQNAFVAVVNASPGTSAYTVFADTSNIYPGNTIAYGSSTGVAGGNPYETIISGTRALKLTADGTNFVVDSSLNFTTNGYYSVFVYDTAGSSGKLRTLVLHDDLTIPPSAKSEVRFLNLSPNVQAYNIAIINTDSTLADTLNLANLSYIGASAINADSLSTFRIIDPGTYKVTVSSGLNNQNLFTSQEFTFMAGKIYTLYAKGYQNGVGADSLGINIINNN